MHAFVPKRPYAYRSWLTPLVCQGHEHRDTARLSSPQDLALLEVARNHCTQGQRRPILRCRPTRSSWTCTPYAVAGPFIRSYAGASQAGMRLFASRTYAEYSDVALSHRPKTAE